MSSETTKDLQDLLKQAREYLSYFRELGAETIDSEPLGASLAEVTVSETIKPSAELVARPVPPISTTSPKPLFARREAPTTSPSSQTLFGDTPVTASMPQSNETLEEIWRDIGE